jgi:hypothetical protein
MSKYRWATVIALVVVGLLLIALAIVYFAEPAKSLPGMFPATKRARRITTSSTASPRLLGIGALVSPGSRRAPKTRSLNA